MTRLSDEQLRSRQDDLPAPPEVLERQEAASRILQLLEGLPANQREVIRLKFQNGFSYKEISRISGHSVSNVGFLIHVGLKTIRSRMGVPAHHSAPAQP
jgi:RNA polymerase sigma-70 factor (ECF subfamily)